MNPEEIKALADMLIQNTPDGTTDYSAVWVLVSACVAFAPFVYRHFRDVKIQLEQQKQLMLIMDLHIDELKHVKSEVEDVKKNQVEMGLNIRENTTKIGSLKEAIKDRCA